MDGLVNLMAKIFVGSSETKPSVGSAANWIDHHLVDQTIDRVAEELATEEDRPSTLSGFMGWFDTKIVDGLVNRIADGVNALAKGARNLQPGKVQLYISLTVLVLLALVAYLIYFGHN